MKKFLFVFSIASLLVACTSGPTSSAGGTNSPTTSDDPITSDESTTSHNPITSDESTTSQDPTTSDESTTSQEESSSSQDGPKKATTLYMIGDSTCADYDLTKSNTSYYYQIQGFGKTIADYFDSNVTVTNLGVGGASSKSFPELEKSVEKYNTFKNSIKEGDYVIITFGHNDEKKTDVGTVTVNDGKDNEGTFQYYLYTNFIDVALKAGATPILATPIARYDSRGDYDINSKHMHVTQDDSTFYAGNYAQSIRDLASELGLTCIDTTNLTGDALRALEPTEAQKWFGHPDSKTYDGTHVNEYGAQMVGYMMAKALKESSNPLGQYVLDDIKEPTKEEYLKVNPLYVESSYVAPSDGTWSTNFPNSNGWHGSAFGGLKKSKPDFTKFAITEKGGDSTTGNLNVTISDLDPLYSGRLNSTADGLVMYFQQINKNDSFTLEASLKIDKLTSTAIKQNSNAVGIMVRDDMYIDKHISGLNSRYAATGFFGTAFNDTDPIYTYCSWARRYNDINTKEGKADRIKEKIHPTVGTTIDLRIVKNDTSVKTYYKLEGESVYKDGQSFDTDLELTNVDTEYVYAGLFVAGGTGMEATFSNVKLVINSVK